MPRSAGVLLLTKLLLGAQYRGLHYSGAAVCIAGLAMLVLADGAGSQHSAYPDALLGDVLVLVGASLYAVGNVAQEYLLSEQCVCTAERVPKTNALVLWLLEM